MRVVVTGGRSYKNKEVVWSALDRVHRATPITELINGAAKGADTLAIEWADSKFQEGISDGIPHQEWYADWEKYGRSAGAIRNGQMIRTAPDMVIAFPGGRGTADCIRQAVKAGLKVWDVCDVWGQLNIEKPVCVRK